MNLVIYYLRQNDTQEAYDLIKDLEPSVPQEYILKGVVNAVVGQEKKSVSTEYTRKESILNEPFLSLLQQDYIKIAQQYFQLVGTSASECDTIPGRQCMASFYFLFQQFKDVLIYLNSIKTYFPNIDNFNFNYAQAQVATGHYKEAEEAFLAVRNERYRNDFAYTSLLAYCCKLPKKFLIVVNILRIVLISFRHNEQKRSIGLGIVFENGTVVGIVQFTSTYCQHLLHGW